MSKHFLRTEIPGLSLAVSDEPFQGSLTTSGLQKGLTLHYHEEELVQEGLGFGAPIIRTPAETIFSRHARLEVHNERIIKDYELDCTSRITLKGKPVENRAFRFVFERFVKVYMNSESVQPLMLKMQEKLSKALGASSMFTDIPPAGRVRVEYGFQDKSIHIASEFKVNRDNIAFIMANEQGADFFDLALLGSRELSRNRIRGWMRVDEATLESDRLGLWFSVKSRGPEKKFLGRERNEYLCWSGINLEGTTPVFNYDIVYGNDVHD